MPQAKTLTTKELKIVLAALESGRHAARDRALVLMSCWSGMRVGELAALRVGDVISPVGTVKDRVHLAANQTKGNVGRTVILGEKLQRELSSYIASIRCRSDEAPFFYSQRNRSGFSANTLCQHFKSLYEKAGVAGASSHSGRRTFITNLANKGVGVRVLMALAGHRQIATTQRYIDLNENMLVAAANLV